MTEKQGKPHEADFRRLRRTLDVNAHANTPLPLKDFQAQAEAFWNHPYAKKLREDAGPAPRSRPNLSTALKRQTDRLQSAITGDDDSATHRLRRSWTLKDGAIVDITGDDAALPADDKLVVVTSSSTITTEEGIVSYVVVNVFEKDAGR